jgi:thioredoxin-dependent peroxiredoxin
MRCLKPFAAACLCALVIAVVILPATPLPGQSATRPATHPATGPAATRPAGALPPKVGDSAPDFTLSTLDGNAVHLSKLTAEGPVVLVVLRGWPGYQCPICTRQVGEFIARADDLKAAQARVVLVYPGPADGLADHAKEFVAGKNVPAGFTFVVDPDLKFTSGWGLRWDAPKETAYPSTFVVDRQGVVRFALVSKTHGGRAGAADVLKALAPAR